MHDGTRLHGNGTSVCVCVCVAVNGGGENGGAKGGKWNEQLPAG